jgi:ribosomal protein S18 acetylase RimI-like enzyme
MLTIDDYDAITGLWQRAGLPFRPNGRDSREAFATQLASGAQALIGLEVDGALIGVVMTTHDGRKGWINRLAIDPDHRRRGYAKRLIAEAERTLRDMGFVVIGVLIESDNAPSLTLFQETGYEMHKDEIYYLSKRDSWEN